MDYDRNSVCECTKNIRNRKRKHCCGRKQRNTTTVNELLENVRNEFGFDEFDYQRSVVLNETVKNSDEVVRMSGKNIATDKQWMMIEKMTEEARENGQD